MHKVTLASLIPAIPKRLQATSGKPRAARPPPWLVHRLDVPVVVRGFGENRFVTTGVGGNHLWSCRSFGGRNSQSQPTQLLDAAAAIVRQAAAAKTVFPDKADTQSYSRDTK